MFTLKDFSLRELNSFGLDVDCAELNLLCSESDIVNFLTEEQDPFILGGGTNILFTNHISRPIIKPVMQAIELVDEYEQYVHVRVEAGVIWHEFVLWCLDNEYGGVENLSLIPGTVGAAPVQNIGAYGVELDQILVNVECYELSSGNKMIFTNEQCKFRYRDSLFKSERKNDFLISGVVFKLTRDDHIVNQSYAPLAALLKDQDIQSPTLRDVSQAVIQIRQSKLPDPAFIGNAGSFFKNPIVSRQKVQELLTSYPTIKTYPIDDAQVKIPAAWLIDQCGWKGKRFNDAGVHDKHALVLVNHGDATGKQILELSKNISTSVKKMFNIDLETEVNVC